MEPRIDYGKRFPDPRKAMWALEHYVQECDLDPKLLELVKLRIAHQGAAATDRATRRSSR